MAKEDLELKRRTDVCIFGKPLMNLFEDASDSVPVAHLKLGEILIFGIEALLEVGNSLLCIL